MENAVAKFQIVMELRRLGERAFLYKLREKYPDLSQKEINTELTKWYRTRPGAEFGDGVGRVGDPKRFS
jgi:hypothetical protein